MADEKTEHYNLTRKCKFSSVSLFLEGIICGNITTYRWFSVGRFDYKVELIISSALISGNFICKQNPLQDLLSSLNAVIQTNETTRIYNRSCDF